MKTFRAAWMKSSAQVDRIVLKTTRTEYTQLRRKQDLRYRGWMNDQITHDVCMRQCRTSTFYLREMTYFFVRLAQRKQHAEPTDHLKIVSHSNPCERSMVSVSTTRSCPTRQPSTALARLILALRTLSEWKLPSCSSCSSSFPSCETGWWNLLFYLLASLSNFSGFSSAIFITVFKQQLPRRLRLQR